jgi:tetratricopeptide (TPR) repeat protein
MSEPLRSAPSEAPVTEADREALIEKLLLAGLDHYFEGRYEQAVNVWTRVVFLERGHGRARAYIERARGALAERQRQADELLHRGVAAYDAGDLDSARDLLTRAVAEGGANDTALVFLQRLGRVDPVDSSGLRQGAPGDGVPAPARRRRPFRQWRRDGERGPATNWFATIVVSVALAASILLAAQPIASWLGELPVAVPTTEPRPADALPIVRSSEAQLATARSLYASGRLHEAIRVLDGIDVSDPNRADADRLVTDMQRDLLAEAAIPSVVPEAPR